jgi:mannitol-specific phosphotransferase system IIBC component
VISPKRPTEDRSDGYEPWSSDTRVRRMALSRRDLVLAGVGVFIAWGLVVRWLPILRYLGWERTARHSIMVAVYLA